MSKKTGIHKLGKSSLAASLCQMEQRLRLIDVGQLVIQKGLHEGKDEEWDSYILDEDKVCDEMEPMMATRCNIVDHHSCGFFPERW